MTAAEKDVKKKKQKITYNNNNTQLLYFILIIKSTVRETDRDGDQKLKL